MTVWALPGDILVRFSGHLRGEGGLKVLATFLLCTLGRWEVLVPKASGAQGGPPAFLFGGSAGAWAGRGAVLAGAEMLAAVAERFDGGVGGAEAGSL